MPIFKYGSKELTYLKSKDTKLAALIEEYGLVERELTEDCFPALMAQIIGQQISTKAFQTVWSRVQDKLGLVSPENICNQSELLHAAGVSFKKIAYMQGIAEAELSGELDFEDLKQMSDQEIISKLISFAGIGCWSAEMFLIFSLSRPNILSYGDFAIKKSLQKLYELPVLNKAIFASYYELFSPYATTASLYLWAANNLVK